MKTYMQAWQTEPIARKQGRNKKQAIPYTKEDDIIKEKYLIENMLKLY